MPHAPGHLRDVFVEWVEAGMPDGLVGEDVFYEGPRPTRWLLGQLWHCSDIMPGYVCEELDMPRGSTYAMAVRTLVR